MNDVGRFVQGFIGSEDLVLDIGCGIMQASDDLNCKAILGVDIWKPYLERLSLLCPTVTIRCDELNRFVDKSYDVVICLDLLEHLSHEEAINVLKEMKRICRKHVIVYTPQTFDSNKEAVKDSWGMGENPHQEHRCVISRQDLRENGYKVIPNDVIAFWGIYPK